MSALIMIPLAFLFLALFPAVAEAHAPVFLTAGGRRSPVRWWRPATDPERAVALYGHLPEGAGADVIPIQARQGQTLYLQVLVPQRRDHGGFRPRAVLLGPELAGSIPADLPIAAPPRVGAVVVPEPERPAAFFEKYTQVHYWIYGTLEGAYPVTGDYALVVYDPAGRGGPYTAALGRREGFGAKDLLTFPLVWIRVRAWLWG